MKVLFITLMALMAANAFADAKTDFVDTVVKSCGKSKDEAEKIATPGRSGNIIKWQTCSASSIEIEGCNVPCQAAGSKIGN